MGLFNRNPNEVAYVGGKKHWADVIKNSGPGELLIWRQPEEDFNSNSTLVVMPGEEAIFIKGGIVESVSENGTYKLATDNYPFISRIRNAFTGGVSTFNCVVYFVRKADSQEIRWGTDSPIQVRDKVWGVRTDVRVRGAYKVRIENGVKFLEKLIGNNVPFQTQFELQKYFESEFQGKIKSAVSKYLNGLQQELIGIDAYIDELSEQIQPSINEILEEYGLKCVRFSFAALDVDKSKYDYMDQGQMEGINEARQASGRAAAKVTLAQGDRGVMETLGENWGRQQAANILGTLAANPGAGGVAAAGAGMGMGMAAGGAFGSMAQQMFAPMSSPDPVQQQPYQQSASGRFGQPPQDQASPAAPQDRVSKLRELKQLLDEGLIGQSEYDATKAEILNSYK